MCFQDLVRNAAGVEKKYNTEGFKDEHNHVKDEEVYSVEQMLQNLAISRSILEQHYVLNTNCILAFHNCQQELRLERKNDIKQTTAYDQFGRK